MNQMTSDLVSLPRALFVMTCLLWNCSTYEVQCTYLIYAVLIYCYNIRLLLVKMSRYTYKDTHTVVYCLLCDLNIYKEWMLNTVNRIRSWVRAPIGSNQRL